VSDFNPDALQAGLDQLEAFLRNLAPTLSTFYASLRARGMSDYAATEMCRVYFNQLLDEVRKRKE